ncbi:MAG: 30S ribosomal protein S2 [Candidatus Pacearchaeota archaeon]|jgi:ribosomal protein uS2
MAQEKQEERIPMRSLADELKEKMKKEETEEGFQIKKSNKKLAIKDLTDEEIQEASKKISKKEIEKEAKDLKLKTQTETLIPLEDYIKCAVHLGTKVITPHMRKYVYKRRADGLAVINTVAIDEKLRRAIELVIKYDPEQIYLACKREAGWEAAKKFGEATGILIFTKKYPPGVTTNLELEDFFEKELTIICDPWIDKNALVDTARLKKPVLSLCDTNNFTTNITQLIPCNNKSAKSVGCILYILAREYCKNKKIKFDYKLEDFAGQLE